MTHLVSFRLEIFVIRLNRRFYDSIVYLYQHTRAVENVFAKLKGGVSEILKHPLTLNLSIALIESICNLVFNLYYVLALPVP